MAKIVKKLWMTVSGGTMAVDNNCPHGSLDFERLETPEQAFWNRLPERTLLGTAIRCLGWE